MRSPAGNRPDLARPVFINCPFDDECKPLLRVACFTILACGHAPRCALDTIDSGAVRFSEIVKLIAACDLSIHDISRVELDAEAHRYDKTLSDISGMDVAAHGNEARLLIRHVRDWLNANRPHGTPILPGAAAIAEDHELYLRLAPGLAKGLRLDPHDDLPHGDYLYIVREALPLIEAARASEP